MEEERRKTDEPDAHPDASRYLRLHARAYAFGAGVIFLVDLVTPGPWWFFWPVVVWGALVLLHYLYVKTISIDNRWADRRASEVVDKAYDLGHIEDIRKRYDGKPPPGPDAGKAEDRRAAPVRDPSECDAG